MKTVTFCCNGLESLQASWPKSGCIANFPRDLTFHAGTRRNNAELLMFWPAAPRQQPATHWRCRDAEQRAPAQASGPGRLPRRNGGVEHAANVTVQLPGGAVQAPGVRATVQQHIRRG